MIQKNKKLVIFTLIFSFLLLGTGVFVNNNKEVEASDGEMLTMLRGMNQVLGLIAERLSPFNVDNGNVGIGINNPNSPLHLKNTGPSHSNEPILFIDGHLGDGDYAGGGVMRLNRHSTKSYRNAIELWTGLTEGWRIGQNLGSHHFDFDYQGNTHVKIETGGNVGIGTTSPGAKLDVAGDIYADLGSDNTRIIGIKGFGENKTAIIRVGDRHNQLENTVHKNMTMRGYHSIELVGSTTGSSNDKVLRVKEEATDRMVINKGGNVGIGTTSPQETLHVDGNLKVEGNIIGGSPVKIAEGLEVEGRLCVGENCISEEELCIGETCFTEEEAEKLKELME